MSGFATELLTSRVSPNNIQAEQAVLGAMLDNPAALTAGVSQLTEAMFFTTAHQRIFASLRRLHADSHGADLLTVTQALRDTGELEEVGGPAGLAALVEVAVLHVLLPPYIAIVREAATRRELIKRAADMGGAAYSGFAARDLIDAVARRLRALAAQAEDARRGPPVDRSAIWAAGATLHQRPSRAIAHLVEGLIPAAGTVLVTGEDKVGKSTVAVLLVLSYMYGATFLGRAIPRPGRAIIVSEEDDADELRDRMRALHQGLARAYQDLVTAPDDPASLALVEDRLVWEARADLRLDDDAMLDDLVAKVTALRGRKPDGPPVLLLIDSLQAVRGLTDPTKPEGLALLKIALRRLTAAGAVVRPWRRRTTSAETRSRRRDPRSHPPLRRRVLHRDVLRHVAPRLRGLVAAAGRAGALERRSCDRRPPRPHVQDRQHYGADAEMARMSGPTRRMGRGPLRADDAQKPPIQQGLGSESLPLAAAAVRLRRPPGRPRKVQAPVGAGAPQAPALSFTTTRSTAYEPAVPPLCPISPRLLDLSTTAGYLGVSSWTVRDLEAAGVLPRVRFPVPGGGELRKLLFDKNDLDRLIDRSKDSAR